jgi:hypothetical protein
LVHRNKVSIQTPQIRQGTFPFKGGTLTLTLGMSRLSAVVHTFSAFGKIYR